MTTIDPSASLGDIVTGHPGLVRHLERLGLDYCCGGQRTLGAACADRGLDPSVVVAELAVEADAMSPEPWAAMSPHDLVDHVEATHHAYLHREMPRIEALLEKVEGVHGARHPELAFVQTTFDELTLELDPHLAREERILFPLIREWDDGGSPDLVADAERSLADHLRVMEGEHDRAGALLDQLRRLTDGYLVPGDACASYQALYAALAELEADTHLHVHKENNVLFAAVREHVVPAADADR